MPYGLGYLKQKLYSVKKGIYNFIGNALRILIECGLISYADTVVDGFMEDKVGFETRPSVKAKYILGDGILTVDMGLLNEPLTYLDADTLLDVAGTTDGSGFFVFPNTKKVADIKITSTGDYFKLEEGVGDTIADHVNGRIAKLSATPTWIEVNNIQSRADQIGYTLSDGINYYWDELLTDLIPIGVIIANISSYESVSWVSEIFF